MQLPRRQPGQLPIQLPRQFSRVLHEELPRRLPLPVLQELALTTSTCRSILRNRFSCLDYLELGEDQEESQPLHSLGAAREEGQGSLIHSETFKIILEKRKVYGLLFYFSDFTFIR